MAEFAFNLINEIGEQKFMDLGILAKKPKKWTILELEKIQLEVNSLFLKGDLPDKLKIYKQVKNL